MAREDTGCGCGNRRSGQSGVRTTHESLTETALRATQATLRGAAALVEPRQGVCLSHPYMSCVSALASSTRNAAIFVLTASTYLRPFSGVAAAGFPTPVSSVTWRHCRGAHAQPSRSPAIVKRRAVPGPASDKGRTSSGARCSMTLVSSSPAWSPRSAKNAFGSITWYQLMDPKAFFADLGDHAGELETSVMLHLAPELVRPLSEAGPGTARRFTIAGLREGWAWAPRQWRQVTDDTGVGNPAAATPEKGRKYVDAVSEKIAAFLVELARADTHDMYG